MAAATPVAPALLGVGLLATLTERLDAADARAAIHYPPTETR